MELILEGNSGEEGNVSVTVESLCCLVLLDYLNCTVPVTVVPPETSPAASYRLPEVVSFVDKVNVLTKLPSLRLESGRFTIAGLAAVLRQLCRVGGDRGKELLGFRGSCLCAPAEVSPWTRFCEVDIVKAAVTNLTSQLERLETHLLTPPRVHNRGSRPGWDNLEQRFLEGPDYVLADFIVAICLYVGQKSCDLANYPATSSWFERVKCSKGLRVLLEKIAASDNISSDVELDATVCEEKLSLYRKSREGRRNVFTNRDLVEGILVKIEGIGNISVACSKYPTGWEASKVELPAVPEQRQARKRQQVESMARAIVGATHPGDTIVDFCAGSGHVGLAVATLAPDLTVILVDNKEASVARAAEAAAPLNNVKLVQANLATFNAPFQLGCALHACGVATDLVLTKCVSQKAACVLSPCCYGAIKSNYKVEYPLSDAYQAAGLTEEELICLGHCADTEHSILGARSMRAVDSDRCLALEECGYEVVLSKLDPPECSSKNNLIIATPT